MHVDGEPGVSSRSGVRGSCSDPSVQTVSLTLDSSLVGYVRSTRKAAACVRLASASITPGSWDGNPLVIAHPTHCAEDRGSAVQPAPPLLQGPTMPLGRFTLVANFVLDTTASGVCNAHALPISRLIRRCQPIGYGCATRFTGVSKKSFGFTHFRSRRPRHRARPSRSSGQASAIAHRAVRRQARQPRRLTEEPTRRLFDAKVGTLR